MENNESTTGMPGFTPARTADDVADRLDAGAGAGVGVEHATDAAIDHQPSAPQAGSVGTTDAGARRDFIDATARGEFPPLPATNPDTVAPARTREGLNPKDEARALLSELEGVENTLDALEVRKADIRKQLAKALANISPEPDEQKIVTPFGSASLGDGARRVKITGTVPTDFMKTVPDEKKIGDALRAGNVVAGAELGNGGEKVVRVTWPKK